MTMTPAARSKGANLPRALGLLVAAAVAARPLLAQQSPAPTPAAATIAATDLAKHLAVLAADSMRGATPSAALERSARYVAAEFAALGLPTAGGLGVMPQLMRTVDTNSVARYPLPQQLTIDMTAEGPPARASYLMFYTQLRRGSDAVVSESGDDVTLPARLDFATTARFLDPLVSRPAYTFNYLSSRTVLVAGPHSLASVRQADVAGQVVLYVPPPHTDTAHWQPLTRALAARSEGVVVLHTADSAAFAAAVRAAAAHPPRLLDDYLPRAHAWRVAVWAGALAPLLDRLGLRLPELQATATPLVQPLPLVRNLVNWAPVPRADRVTAPLVVATVPGSDPQLRQEYLVITAPLDRRGAGDSDGGTGVAGLLALAKAFSAPGARPKRSLVLLATSGGEEAWGAHAFIAKQVRPPRLVVTLEGRGDLPSDQVAVAGVRELELAVSPGWLAAAHPELGLVVLDTGSVVTAAAGAFTARRLPTLAVRVGQPVSPPRGQPGTPASTPASAPPVAAALARQFQLLVYTLRALADAEAAPRWAAAARRALGAAP